MENKTKDSLSTLLIVILIIAVIISAYSLWKVNEIKGELSEQTEEKVEEEIEEEAEEEEIEEEVEEEENAKPEEDEKVFINIENSDNEPSFDKSKQTYYVTGEISPNCNEIFVDASNDGKNIDSDFKLKEFEAGDEEFVYRMKESFGNLENGDNVYTFTAFCDNGKTVRTDFSFSHQMAQINISSSGNKPEYDFSRDAYTINGDITNNCNEIYVDAKHESRVLDSQYKLKDFSTGDTEFTYRMSEEFKNLKPGWNTYTFTAHCNNYQVLEATYTFIYQPY